MWQPRTSPFTATHPDDTAGVPRSLDESIHPAELQSTSLRSTRRINTDHHQVLSTKIFVVSIPGSQLLNTKIFVAATTPKFDPVTRLIGGLKEYDLVKLPLQLRKRNIRQNHVRLFEKYPDVQDIFIPFKGQTLEELKNSDRLREHGLQVMRTVEKVIARLDEPQKMDTMLYELGQKHVLFNTKVDYMDLIGPQFILAIKPTVQDSWTFETEEAWSDFFKLVTFVMKKAMVF